MKKLFFIIVSLFWPTLTVGQFYLYYSKDVASQRTLDSLFFVPLESVPYISQQISSQKYKAKLYKSRGQEKELALIYYRLACTYLQLAESNRIGNSGDSSIPENRKKILEMASNYCTLSIKSQQPWDAPGVLRILSTVRRLQGKYDSALLAQLEYIRYRDSFDKRRSIEYNNMLREASYEHDSIDLETEKRKLRLEQEIRVTALNYAFEKEQFAAKSEEEKRRIILENEIKRKEATYSYFRKQEREIAKQDKEKERIKQHEELRRSRLKQWLFGSITFFTCLGLIAVFFIFRNRVQKLKLKNELQKEKADMLLKEAEYKSKMNDITFTALRAQMNPHFIFNCLNSIKLYTEQNNTEAASQYLGKFSRLIRNMLDSGRAESITLSQELESLRLYLEMEAMRFKQKLHYIIHVDKDIDEEFIEIPPLLIQPYVENAIWHGLMHKEEGGTIHIDVLQSLDHSLLVITIIDDGIGREKAAAVRSKTSVQHKSYGTKVTGERIALINEKYNAGAEAVITDLFDACNEPAGTSVTIKIPIR